MRIITRCDIRIVLFPRLQIGSITVLGTQLCFANEVAGFTVVGLAFG
jgi:hypothetical protein